MTIRKFGTIKSLLHFDYPYFNEPNDGLGDEVSGEVWTRVGNTKLAGKKIPYDVSGTPKFGYRCAYFPDTNSAIRGTNTSGIFNLSPIGSYEIEAFYCVTIHSPSSNIFTIGDLSLKIDATARHYTLSSPTWGIDETSKMLLSDGGRWMHILLRISHGSVKVFQEDLYPETLYGGHTFKAFRFNGYFGDAEADCENLGGHLATSTSAEKNAFLSSLCRLASASCWIGLKYYQDEGKFKWITGEELEYANWYSGYPKSYSEYNYPGVLLTNDGTWYNVPNRSYLGYIDGFICEWDEELSFEGNPIIQASITGNSEIRTETITLGGYIGYMDEFCFRHSAGSRTPSIPTQPYS